MRNENYQSGINNADIHLRIAKEGLAKFLMDWKDLTGLYNIAMSGRALTFAIQNAISGFDDARKLYEEKHRPLLNSSQACLFFKNLRNQIEKAGAPSVSVSGMKIYSFSSEDIKRFYRPKGATAFFIGDREGRSGWEIKNADGTSSYYYVDIPADIAMSILAIGELQKDVKVPDSGDLVEWAEEYIKILDQFLSEIKEVLRS